MPLTLARAAASLETLDAFAGDLLCVGVFADERPLQGAAGLVDWRTGTWLTMALRRGWLSGAEGESLLFPPGRRLGARGVAAVGLGSAARLEGAALDRAAGQLARVAARFGARDLAVELPRRAEGGAAEAALRRALDAELPDGARVLVLG